MSIRRRFILMLLLSFPILYAGFVIAFNITWKQASPQASLIHVAELELDAVGLNFCQDQHEVQRDLLASSQHDCRWWRVPYDRGAYCGYLNELIKPSQNCFEVVFEKQTPDAVLNIFRIAFENPCILVERYKADRHYASSYRNLKCDRGEEYRQFTVFTLIVTSFVDDETKRLVQEFGELLTIEKIRRTKKWQFI